MPIYRLIFVFTFMLIGTLSFAATTYEIAEPDVMETLLKKKDEVVEKIKKYQKKAQSIVDNSMGEPVPPAPEDRYFYVDVTHTLQKDIIDKNGNIIYPKGYQFNPIQYLNVDAPPMVVFNPCIQEEREKVKEIINNWHDYMLLSSGCKSKDTKHLPSDFTVPVFYLTKEVQDKFNVQHTVSVISTDRIENRIRVQEYAVLKK